MLGLKYIRPGFLKFVGIFSNFASCRRPVLLKIASLESCAVYHSHAFQIELLLFRFVSAAQLEFYNKFDIFLHYGEAADGRREQMSLQTFPGHC